MLDKKKIYRIKLNGKQLITMREALEFYSRFICGQIDYFPSELEKILWEKKLNQHSSPIQQHLSAIKKIIWGLPANGNMGVNWNNEADLSYEMYKMIYHYYLKDAEHWTVHKSSPLKLTNEPLIEIHEEEHKEE